MRKLSELLRICSKYNYYFNPEADSVGMCLSATHAASEGVITWTEQDFVVRECSALVDEVNDRLGGGWYRYLTSALSHLLGDFQCNMSPTIQQVYGAWIDKLESEGK